MKIIGLIVFIFIGLFLGGFCAYVEEVIENKRKQKTIKNAKRIISDKKLINDIVKFGGNLSDLKDKGIKFAKPNIIKNIMKKQKIKLTDEEMEFFDFTDGEQWELRGETYDFVEKIRTDEMSDGESWDIVVKRQSDNKFFKWNCWDAGDHNGFMMESGDNYIEEVIPEVITKTIYK